MQAINRRTFVGTVTALATGAVAARPARAIEPFKREGKSVLKLSLAAYSFNRQLSGRGAKIKMDLLGFIDYCAKLGVEGAELTSYYFPETITQEYLHEVKRRTHLAGLTISGGAIKNDFCQPPGPKLDADFVHVQKWIDYYAELGAPHIRVFAGTVPKGQSEDVSLERCIKGLEQACDMAGKRGIFLGLENHGGITTKAETMLKILRGVKSPWLGVNLDSGNFRDYDDPYAAQSQIAPYAVNVQIKTEVFRGKKKEPADLKRVIDLLQQAGYSGWLALEYEAAEDPFKAVPRHIEVLRRLIHG